MTLWADSDHFLATVLAILNGVSANWGGGFIRALREQEKENIKTYLGIN